MKISIYIDQLRAEACHNVFLKLYYIKKIIFQLLFTLFPINLLEAIELNKLFKV